MSKLTATQTNAINAYDSFLKAGTSYGEAMRKAAAELGETPCLTLLEGLAKVHAKRYGCNFTTGKAGGFVFYDGAESTRDSRNHGADKSWKRNVMVWFTPEREAKPAPKSMRLSKDVRALAEAYLANFENVADAIKALRAVA